jgi:hypothetical protein
VRRVLLVLALLLPAVGAPAAGAETYRLDVVALLGPQLADARQAGTVPILLPSRLPSERRRLYPSGGSTPDRYAFGLTTVPDCGGATACFAASFTAERGGRPAYGRRVRLTGGRRGYYKPLTCGASCSAPELQWLEDDVLYGIAAIVGPARVERRRMVAMANSAIRNGPR